MSFMRTSGGINAQRKFHRVDLTFHIEGKNIKTTPGFKVTDLCDYKYYKALLEHFLPNRKIKIQVLGCCSDVLEYNNIIVRDNLENNLAIVDRDFNGIIKSRLNDKGVIYTHGYSWENDFWSENICCHIIAMLTAGSVESVKKFSKSINRCMRRLAILNKINICFKSHGVILFKIAKKGGKRGIALNFNSNFILSRKEFSRLILAAKTSPHKSSASEIYNKINCEESRLVQGHFFEHLVCGLIVSSTKAHSSVKGDIDSEAIKNLALFTFSNTPKLWLKDDVYSHYENSLSNLS